MITVLGTPCTLEDLKTIPMVRPERAGTRWRAIPHYDLAQQLHFGLAKRGIAVTSEKWALDPTGQDLVGGFNVRLPESLGIDVPAGTDHALAVRHSNRLRFALTMSCGVSVVVCQNGVLTGEWIVSRKHTLGVDLEQVVETGVSRFVDEVRGATQVVENLKAQRISSSRADSLFMESGRQKILPWSHLGQAYELYRHPRHEQFQLGTGWGLMNAVNEIVKKQNPARQLRSLGRFRELLLN